MEYRKGLWVTVGGRVGILNDLDVRASLGKVHFVDAEGCTESIVGDVPFGAIAQAAWLDIPAPRRPDEETARAFGYL